MKTNTITIVSEDSNLQNFELKSTVAFLGGWQMGKKHKSKVSICFANFDVQLSSYDVEMPKNEGELVIAISFVGEFAPSDDKLRAIQSGEFEYGSSLGAGQSLSVVAWKNGGAVEEFANTAQQTGSAELTHIDEQSVSGNMTLKTAEGTEINANFDMPIEKDFWEKLR